MRRLLVIGIGSGRPVRIGRAGPESGANYDARELTADRVNYLRSTPTECCSGRASNRCATPEVKGRAACVARSSASLVVVKLIVRQVGPPAAAFFRLVAKTTRLQQQGSLLSSVLESLPLPIEFRRFPLKFIALRRELRYELFAFLSFHHFPFGPVNFTPSATPV